MTEPVIEKMTEYGWNVLLARIAAELPDLYPLVYWLHVSGEVDLDAQQIAAFLAELVRAGAI